MLSHLQFIQKAVTIRTITIDEKIRKVFAMFAFGEAQSVVSGGKVRLPKEYNLRKKDRVIYAVWANEKELYLSDEAACLKTHIGKDSKIFEPSINAESCMEVPDELEGRNVTITGCITTIQVEFS